MDSFGWDKRALVARKRAYGRRVAQVQERRQRSQCTGAICVNLLLDWQHVNGREVRLSGFLLIYVSECGVRRAEIDTDVHGLTVTLQLRRARAR
jgi:hypothetical protein